MQELVDKAFLGTSMNAGQTIRRPKNVSENEARRMRAAKQMTVPGARSVPAAQNALTWRARRNRTAVAFLATVSFVSRQRRRELY